MFTRATVAAAAVAAASAFAPAPAGINGQVILPVVFTHTCSSGCCAPEACSPIWMTRLLVAVSLVMGVSRRRINAAFRGIQRASGKWQFIGSTRSWRQYLEACFAMPGQGRLCISCPCCRSAPRRRRSGHSIRCRSRSTVMAMGVPAASKTAVGL